MSTSALPTVGPTSGSAFTAAATSIRISALERIAEPSFERGEAGVGRRERMAPAERTGEEHSLPDVDAKVRLRRDLEIHRSVRRAEHVFVSPPEKLHQPRIQPELRAEGHAPQGDAELRLNRPQRQRL